MKLAVGFGVTPEQAVAFYQTKGVRETWSWRDMTAVEHEHAFTVAKMMDMDLLREVQAEVLTAIKDGTNLAAFKRELIPRLQEAGWWGKSEVINPKTKLPEIVQLGSPARLQTIFRTNMQSAYGHGNWQAIEVEKDIAPWILYDAIDDKRTRPAHAKLDDFVAPVDDPVWNKISPPNGHQCRCSIIQLDDEQLAELGIDPAASAQKLKDSGIITEVEDQHFDSNPGKARDSTLLKAYTEKFKALPEPMQQKATPPKDVKKVAIKATTKPVPPPRPATPENLVEHTKRMETVKVLNQGNATGHEHVSVVNLTDGKLLGNRTSESATHVSFPEKWRPALQNKKNRLSVIHNHPSGNGLSLGDLQLTNGFTGVEECIAVTADGAEFVVKKGRRLALTREQLKLAHEHARQAAIDAVLIDDPKIERLVGNHPKKGRFLNMLINDTLSDEGFIHHTVARPGAALKSVLDTLSDVDLDYIRNQVVERFRRLHGIKVAVPKIVPPKIVKPKVSPPKIVKPKPPAPAPAPATPPAKVEPKRSAVKQARIDKMRKQQADKKAAEEKAKGPVLKARETERSILLYHDETTHNEHMSLIDLKTGKVIGRNTDNRPSSVGPPKRGDARGRFKDPEERLSWYHNHPNSSSLSAADVSLAMRKPGIEEVVAVGADGSIYRTVSKSFGNVNPRFLDAAAADMQRVWMTGYESAQFSTRSNVGLSAEAKAFVKADKKRRGDKQTPLNHGAEDVRYLLAIHLVNEIISDMGYAKYYADSLGVHLKKFMDLAGPEYVAKHKEKIRKLMEMEKMR